MKTKEELDLIKEEVGTLSAKLAALTGEEMEQVSGGRREQIKSCQYCRSKQITFTGFTCILDSQGQKHYCSAYRCNACGQITNFDNDTGMPVTGQTIW